MKATYVQKGENINYKNPTEDKITLGTLIIIGAICAVAADDIEPGGPPVKIIPFGLMSLIF